MAYPFKREPENKEDDKALQKIIDYKGTFETPAGQRVLNDLEVYCKFYQFTKLPVGKDGHTDVHEVVFQAGQRRIVARIKHIMNCDPSEKKGIKNG